jgi:hypothetical protein
MRIVAFPARLFVSGALLAVLIACSPNTESARQPDARPTELRRWGLQAYAYTSPVPPLEPTALDGSYRRVLTPTQTGGPPIACRRCAPYRLDPGTTRLVFDKGRYFLLFQPIGTGDLCPGCKPAGSFRATGHVVVTGNRMELFNDPNCEESRGVYRWNTEGETLTFETVSDDCFGGIRDRFLTERPWRVD